jgi:mannosyltransferase
MRSRRLPIILPVLVLLTAFALRVYHLGHQAIWGDEAFSIAIGKLPLAQVIAGGTDTHPPLFHSLLHFWMPLAGDNPLSVRFLSVIPGMLMVAAIYALGRRLIGRWPALLATSLAAISSFAIYYSQETRMYAWAAALTALSVYAFLRLVDAALPDTSAAKNNLTWAKVTWPLIYLIATLAAMYSHYYVFFVIMAEDMYALWHGWRKRRWLLAWIGGQAVLAIAYLPWIFAQTGFLSGRANTRFDAWGPSGMEDVWVRSLIAFGGGTSIPTGVEWIALGLFAFVVLGIGAILWRHSTLASECPLRAFAVLYLVVPMLVAWLVGPIMPFFYERFLLVALPAYLLLLAAGLAALMQTRPLPPILGLLGAVLAVGLNAYSLDNYYDNPAYTKSGYRDLMAYVTQASQPGDALLLLNPEQRYLYDYYGDKSLPAYWFPLPAPWDDPTTQRTMANIKANHQRLWLVLFGNARDWDFGHGLEDWLSTHTFRAYHGDYVDGGLELYIVGDVQPTQPIDASFAGAISLTGYGVSSTTVSPGGTLQVALAWKTGQKMTHDYTIFTHLVDDTQHIWGQMDSPPAGGNHPTSTWQIGETSIDRLAFQVDPTTPPGVYWLQVGWYDRATMDRLPAFDATDASIGDYVLLVQITVE